MWALARNRDAVGAGILAGAAGYFVMATFNNAFLFMQVSVVVFVPIGFGLARAVGPRAQSAPSAEAETP